MKKLLVLTLLAVSMSAMAQHGFRPHHRYYPSYGWVAPTLIGGVIGYEIARNQQVPYYGYVPPPVIVQQVPQQYGQTCTVWTEVQQPDGTITRTRTCNQ
jgi:hypothetical protein